MQKELFGGDRFVPITYAKDWAVVRDVAEKSGTPYNRAAYEAESKREAEAAAKRAAAAAAAPAKKQ
jgi:phosphonate transport system substrate-binding protein